MVRAEAAAGARARARIKAKRVSMSDQLNGSSRAVNGDAIVRVERVGKTVPSGGSGLTILHEISFDVHAGEAVAIVGMSGSGKSTLLGLMAGLDTPTAGAIRIDGHDLFALDE